LRPSMLYSSGEVVEAADFRRAFERGFRLSPADHTGLYGELVGGAACGKEPRTCDLSQGIVTDDGTRTITFHLVAPDPEFLYKLTLPFAYPVPPSVPDDEQVTGGIPGTGPYMLEAPMTPEGFALVRNPQFDVWSPEAQPDGNADRIEWLFGIEPEAQVDAVAAGDADVAFEASFSARLPEIFVRFAAQVHASPSATTYYVVFDTQTPPFDVGEARRAMNFALDRERVVQFLGGEPTCQQLPPNFPGYEPYCPYTMDPGPGGSGVWIAPDLEKARRMVGRSGTAGMRVVLEYVPGYFPPGLINYMDHLLDDVGYRGSVRSVSLGEFYSPRNEFQMALTGWFADYPAASNFFDITLRCGASSPPAGAAASRRPRAAVRYIRRSRLRGYGRPPVRARRSQGAGPAVTSTDVLRGAGGRSRATRADG